MAELIKNTVWEQSLRSEYKLVVDTNLIFNRKKAGSGDVERYKVPSCHQGISTNLGTPIPRQASADTSCGELRMVLATAAEDSRELRRLDVNQTFTRADIEKRMNTELPVEYHDFLGFVGRLNRDIHGLIQASRCWNKKVATSVKTLGFEQ